MCDVSARAVRKYQPPAPAAAPATHRTAMRLPFLLALLLLLLPPLSRRAAAFSLVAPPTGQTKGAALLVDKCCIRAGDADLLSDINWSIMPGERWAICGANGTGKTTLLTSIVGGREIAEGQVLVKQGTKLGFLEQKGVAGSVRSVYEEARSQMEATDAGLRLEKIQASLEKDDSPSAEAVEALLRAQATFEAVGGLTQEKDVAEVLSGLGFSAEDRDRSCTEFSGGWQMRIALATVLLSSSTLLVLDEPTNHLDKNAKYWLAGWLKRYDGTIVLVSHDEELLKGLALSGVAETNAGRLDIFKGCSFEMYQKERVLREEMALKRAEAEQREIDRLQGFVDRFGAQATKASAAQSRVKQIEKLEAARAARNDLPDTQASRRATLQLPKPPACGRVQITMKDGAFGHDGVNPIVSDASVTIEKGFRLAILGPNGAGKSTTLSALSGELPLLKGTRNVGEDVVLGVFKQDLAQELPADEVALEHVLKVARQTDMSISDERARGALGALGLTGDKALRKIGMLSGGEKSRVALAIFSLKPANCLLLDEPSNHLDTGTLNVLAEALKKWGGTVIVVSHNPQFVEALRPTHTAVVNNGSLQWCNRPPEDQDWQWGGEEVAAPSSSRKGKPAVQKTLSKEEKRMQEKERKRRLNAPSRIKKIEAMVATLDDEMKAVDDKMMAAGSDVSKAMELSEKKTELEGRSKKLYQEWEELESLLSSERA